MASQTVGPWERDSWCFSWGWHWLFFHSTAILTVLSRLDTSIRVFPLLLDLEVMGHGHGKYLMNEERTEWNRSNRAFLASPRTECSCCYVHTRLWKAVSSRSLQITEAAVNELIDCLD